LVAHGFLFSLPVHGLSPLARAGSELSMHCALPLPTPAAACCVLRAVFCVLSW
jgi:hypothetical protein